MSGAQDYEKQVRAIIGTVAKGDTIQLKWNTLAEAKLRKADITQLQKQLRLVKKDLGLVKKAINSSYTTEKTNIGKGFGASFAAGLFGKKAVGSSNAAIRDNLRRKQASDIAPYDKVNRLIDNLLVHLDQVKLQIDSWIVANS